MALRTSAISVIILFIEKYVDPLFWYFFLTKSNKHTHYILQDFKSSFKTKYKRCIIYYFSYVVSNNL